MKWLAAALVIAACGHRGATCSDDLGGVWIDGDGRKWMMLDETGGLEAYPMFDDAGPTNDVVLAPRVIGLQRIGGGLDGETRRRYMRRAATCEARARLSVIACHDDALDIARGDIAAPTAFEPCVWPPTAAIHADRWHR